MKLIDILSNPIFEATNPDEYVGDHSAPGKQDNSPMHDVTDMFPDMYTNNAMRYYGYDGLDTASVISQIQNVRNKPNKLIKIYRAVPYVNKDIDIQIKELNALHNYRFKFGFYPMNNKTIDKIETEIESKFPDLTYKERKDKIADEISKMTDNLMAQRQKPLKINNGDWVTTSKLYANEHGKDHLKHYKIVTKTVKASQLYTDGNSVFEWGYVE